MIEYVDLIGKSFRNLTVIDIAKNPKKPRKNSGLWWKCLCICGNEIIVTTYKLVAGRVGSCGCQKNEMMSKISEYMAIDLTGVIFEYLTAIKKERRKKNGKYFVYWLCTCRCGKEIYVETSRLKNGTTTSCGCLRKKRMSASKKKSFGESTFNNVYETYKRNAKKRNLCFELDKITFKQITQKNCFYCNRSPNNVFKKNYENGDFTYNGIDRFDNNLGYTLENCVPCCANCNRAKYKNTYNDFILWVRELYNNLIIQQPDTNLF